MSDNFRFAGFNLDNDDRDTSKDNLLLGLTGAGVSTLLRSGPNKDRFADQIDRARILSEVDQIRGPGAWKRRLFPPKNTLDPRLTSAFVEGGIPQVREVLNDVIDDYVPASKFVDWQPADLTHSGEYLPLRNSQNLPDIFTVTPNPQSARFAGDAKDVGGGISRAIWGNTGKLQKGYAKGNINVQAVDSSNPSIHFTGAELPDDQRREYMYTGDAQESTPEQRGWGMRSRDPKTPIGGDHDIYFGPEHRKIAGLTTANDIYTFLRHQNQDLPESFSIDNVKSLDFLTKKLADYTGLPEEEAALSIASPEDIGGNITRNTGTLPRAAGRNWHLNDEISKKIGQDKFFGLTQLPPSVAKKMYKDRYFLQPDIESTHQVHIKDDLDKTLRRWKGGPLEKPFEFGDTMFTHYPGIRDTAREFSPSSSFHSEPLMHGRALTKRHVPGLMGTLLTSPEAAAKANAGDYLGAAGDIGLGYAGGELTSGGINLALQQLAKRAPEAATRLTQATRGVGNLLTSPALIGISAIDTASSLATGKNARELLVDTDNVGPAIATMSAPQTMAPLGNAGVINATVPVDADTQARAITRQQNTKAKVQKAKERGGRWGIGPLRLPEFGITERATAPLLTDVKRKKVMAVLNGKEGYMIQGDPSSFRMANWSDDARKRFYRR